MAGVGALTGAVSSGLVRQAETDTGTSVTLLKKALQSDRDLVATLLPTSSPSSSGLDIRA